MRKFLAVFILALAFQATAKDFPEKPVRLIVPLPPGIAISALTINPSLRKDLPYDTLKDFAPLTQIGNTVMALVAVADFPAGDLRGLLAEAKKKPGALACASLGVGTGTHLAGELLKMRAGRITGR